MHLPKITIDDFFTTQEERDKGKLEYVQTIPIKEITSFPNHPYKVRDDEEMFGMAESIQKFGVIHPVLVRPKKNGGYEMISGHRRKRASEIAGKDEIIAIVREMTDEEAIITMVDSNNQREEVLPSEKAFAYKMRLDAMKRQAGRPSKENDVPTAQNLKGKSSREILGEEVGESQDQIRRYIRLTFLIPQLLKMVDDKVMALRPAVELSYLKEEEQEMVVDAIEYLDALPSHKQAKDMKEKSMQDVLTSDDIDDILGAEKPNQKEQIKFKVESVQNYFPKGYTIQQMQTTMTKLLEDYKNEWQRKNRQYENVR